MGILLSFLLRDKFPFFRLKSVIENSVHFLVLFPWCWLYNPVHEQNTASVLFIPESSVSCIAGKNDHVFHENPSKSHCILLVLTGPLPLWPWDCKVLSSLNLWSVPPDIHRLTVKEGFPPKWK